MPKPTSAQNLLFGSPVPQAERSLTNPFDAIRQAIERENYHDPETWHASRNKLETRGTTEGNQVNSRKTSDIQNPQVGDLHPTPKNDGFPTTQKQRQLDFWLRLTVQADQVREKLLKLGRHDLAAPLEQCHQHETVAVCQACKRPQSFFNRCEVFWCPICQPRLARDKRKRIEPLALTMHRPRHIILTVRNIAHLTAAKVKWFKDCFKRLRTSKWASTETQLCHIDPADPLCGQTITSHPWKGGVFSLEVTNEGRGAHLHMHVLLDSKFVDALALEKQWHEITEGNGHIVKVLSATDGDYLHEIGKYIVKGSDLATWSGTDLVRFIDAFKDVRTWGAFGTVYAIGKDLKAASKIVDDQTLLCPCGCDKFHYLTQSEWEWFQHTGFLPPPKRWNN